MMGKQAELRQHYRMYVALGLFVCTFVSCQRY